MFEQITDIIGLEIGELLFLVANIALIVIAVFLFIRLRKLRKKSVSGKDKEHELSGIGELKPEEFKPERLGLKPEDIAPAKKTEEGMADKSAKTDELKLEDELPVKEEKAEVKPKKKPAAKKTVKKPVAKKVTKKPAEVKAEVKEEKAEAKPKKKPAVKKPVKKPVAKKVTKKPAEVKAEVKEEKAEAKPKKKPAAKKTVKKAPETKPKKKTAAKKTTKK